MTDRLKSLFATDWDFPDSDKSESIHSIHPYPAKFIPEIPRALIDTLGVPKGSWVFDPFCGSGATLLEAQLAGIPSVGVDVHPIACLISKVKTRPLSNDFLSVASRVALEARLSTAPVTVPSIPNLDHWFQAHVQEEVTKLLTRIEAVKTRNVRDALRVALSSILVRVSNQDSDTRYAAVDKMITREDVYSTFSTACERLWNAKTAHKPRCRKARVLNQDILTVTPDDIEVPVGLVVTSPPYPNAYEYWLYHKYRMFWLGYDPLKVKAQEIGARAHYFKKNPPTVDDFKAQLAYLMILLKETMVKRGHVCIVIGRSKIHGQIIDNAGLVTEVALQYGFTSVASIPRRIATSRKSFNLSHAKIKTEHLLIFRK